MGFGMLIPLRIHNQRMADKDKQIKYLEAIIDKREAQVAKLIESNELIIRLLEGLKAEAGRR